MNESYRSHLEWLEQQLGALASEFTRVQWVIINDYTHEAGVRELERQIGAVCRAIAARFAKGETREISITPGRSPIVHNDKTRHRNALFLRCIGIAKQCKHKRNLLPKKEQNSKVLRPKEVGSGQSLVSIPGMQSA